MVTQVVNVNYANRVIGAVSFNTESGVGAFEYSPDFINSGIELSPIKMPLSSQIFSFPEAGYETFKGLPGLVADSLPDDFGNAVLNAWVAARGQSPNEITPIERLQYTGQRGMGALEYSPATRLKGLNASEKIEILSLVSIAQEILDSRQTFSLTLDHPGEADREAMLSLLSVGMSAGGARPKAVLAFNDDFTQVRSGQVNAAKGFTHHIMKFDGVSEHRQGQETFGDPQGYGAMEYVYYLMATQCGINMMPTRLLDEGSRRHFVTQRFDRLGNDKVHVQTLNGLAHVDYKRPGSYSYAEVFGIARQLRVPAKDAEELLRRLVFNIVARNHDDHSKNFSFMLVDKQWRLSPAYDLAYSYKPGSQWVNSHWMSLNGKRDTFTRDDIYSLETLIPSFSRKKINRVIDKTIEQVSQWSTLATEQDVPKSLATEIASNLRLQL
jgi:serine/threonine-protein kinase HipA